MAGISLSLKLTRADGYGGSRPAIEATDHEVHNVDKKFLIYPNLLPCHQAYGAAAVDDGIITLPVVNKTPKAHLSIGQE